jgi:hypothetical protein
MELMVTIDGAEHATLDLIDGNDSYNQASERGAFDRAYEAKETNPDSVVAIVLAWHPDDEVQLDPEPDHVFIADALAVLADIDEGEHTDAERLRALAESLRQGSLRISEGDGTGAETGAKSGIQGDLIATPRQLPVGQWHVQHADYCPVTSARVGLGVALAASEVGSREHDYLLGAVPEYDLGGDQEVELCTCGRAGRMGGAA